VQPCAALASSLRASSWSVAGIHTGGIIQAAMPATCEQSECKGSGADDKSRRPEGLHLVRLTPTSPPNTGNLKPAFFAFFGAVRRAMGSRPAAPTGRLLGRIGVWPEGKAGR
jgi:hypothetical protein